MKGHGYMFMPQVHVMDYCSSIQLFNGSPIQRPSSTSLMPNGGHVNLVKNWLKKDMLTWPWRKVRSGIDPRWKGTPETSPNAREEKVPHQVSSVQRTHIRVFIHCWMLCDPLGSWTSYKKFITTWWVMSNNGWQRHSAAALRVCASLPAEQESLLRVQWVKIWILKVDWEFLRPAELRPWAELQQVFGVVATFSTVWRKVELVFIRHVRPCAQHSTAIFCAMHMDKDCY